MALVDLVYRCPACGVGSMSGEGRRAACATCGRVYQYVGGSGPVLVLGPSGEEESRVSMAVLLSAEGIPVDGESDPLAAVAPGPDDRMAEATVTARFASEERPVRYLGRLLGFVEQFGARRAGLLRMEPEGLRFLARTGPEWTCSLAEIRAIQTSSSALQVSPSAGGVVSFRFSSDSARRWENLLKADLRAAWRADGRGEIVDFQPRIRSR